MLTSVTLATLMVYASLVTCRLVDPPGRIVQLTWPWWGFIGIVIASVTWLNFTNHEQRVMVPLTVVLILEYFVSLLYKYINDRNPDNNVIMVIHDRYLAVAKYFMVIVPLTLIAIVWMLCTS